MEMSPRGSGAEKREERIGSADLPAPSRSRASVTCSQLQEGKDSPLPYSLRLTLSICSNNRSMHLFCFVSVFWVLFCLFVCFLFASPHSLSNLSPPARYRTWALSSESMES